MSELVRRHGLLIDQPETSSAAEYGHALEALCDVLSDAAGRGLRALHQRDYPFENAVRPFFYFLTVQFANTKHRAPIPVAVAPSLVSYDSLMPMYTAKLNGPHHCLLHQVAEATDPAALIEQLLSVARPGRPPSPPRDRDPGKRATPSRRRLGVSLSWTTFEKLVLSSLDPGQLCFLKKHEPARYALDGRLRRRLLDAFRHEAEDLGASGDEARLLLVTAATLPTFFLEAFDDYIDWVEQEGAGLSGIVGGIEFKDNPRIALLIPWLRSHKRATVGVQHGGAYGQIEPSLWERCERFLFERYVTWGYRYSAQDVPLPSIRLSRPHPFRTLQGSRTGTKQQDRDATLVVLPPVIDLLALTPPVEFHARALRAAMELIDVTTPPGEKLVLRLHPNSSIEDYGATIPDALRARAAITAGSRGTLVADARRYARVIFTEPIATGILECVSGNVDFRIVSDPLYSQFRPEARPIFDALIHARIWITDSQSWTDAEQSSQALSERRREAIDLFARTFIRHQWNYLAVWASFLRETHQASR